ncbi:MAG: carboxypeptidase-like regulatory domain-containing protein [Flavobacteriaceae bacterium]|nr:carboxypeptidase-like regulatory domain-containing protein [Flavobacteriaceae bacterium]
MKKIFLLQLFISFSTFAQIKGIVSDEKGNPLPFVTIFSANTYNGTTSNDSGKYELNIKNTGKQTIVFQYLGFKTQKIAIYIEKLPYLLNVKMIEESYTLNEVVINQKENPANAIIRSAIAIKKENSDKTGKFKADFYSRGIFKVKNLPKKIFGKKIDLGEQMGSNIDSTGSGIIYLSETVSKIAFEKPNNLKEKIIASKISGNNNGFSYNTAGSATYDFYSNTIDFNVNLISPIANNAFNYYKFKLEGTFFDENNQQICKIKVIPKRDKEPVFEGYIYIVDDSWAIYALDLDIKGYRMKNEFVDTMTLKQNFNYNSKNKIWAKNSQSLAFNAGIFGIKFNGKFNYVYSNYEFPDSFEKKTFGKEILSFEENANKKDSIYWNKNRPIPLTIEESNDYTKKDSIYIVRNSKIYLDSIDKKNNKFKIIAILSGYNYKNSSKKISAKYAGLMDLNSLSFNTVQGYSISTGFNFRKRNEENGKNTIINTEINYSFSDTRLRISGYYSHRFNNQDYAYMNILGGTKVNQFNENNPISPLINTVSSLFFKNNFMKLYNLEFAQINYGRDVANGLNLSGKIAYEQRKPLLNTTDHAVVKSTDFYSSNNPLDPNDFLSPGFETHHIVRIGLNGRINFGNKYFSRPDGKFNIRNQKYPTLFVAYEKSVAGSDKKYEFDHVNARLFYDINVGNKGNLAMNLKAGKFFNAENIAFMDFKHFNGNQTHIGGTNRYLNVFNLLPYYSNSTNDSYFEAHSEYNDSGFIMNKIPLLNKLKSTLILGFHELAIPGRKNYSEVSIGLDNLGFGKFKLFRVDYVRSFQNGYQEVGFVFGLKILNALD